MDADDAEPTVLIVSELASNAVEHAGTPFEVSVVLQGTMVEVKVRDYSSAPPELHPHDPFAARGRGLQMVAALAARWSYAEHPDGKTVQADVVLGAWA